jgi:hypothetical protein
MSWVSSVCVGQTILRLNEMVQRPRRWSPAGQSRAGASHLQTVLERVAGGVPGR